MYKILIKNKRIANNYTFYQVEQKTIDVDNNVVTESIDYETEDLTELEETYNNLLQEYAQGSLIPIEQLEADITVDITDDTVESI